MISLNISTESVVCWFEAFFYSIPLNYQDVETLTWVESSNEWIVHGLLSESFMNLVGV